MTEISRHYTFIMSETAVSDLKSVRCRDRDSFDALIVLLQELRCDARMCEQLVDERFFDETIRMVEPFWAAQAEALNAYTVKMYEAERWRLITAADHKSRQIAILAIMERSRDYQNDPALLDQLRRDYDALGFAKLR